MRSKTRSVSRLAASAVFMAGMMALSAAETEKREAVKKIEGRPKGEQRQTFTIQGAPGGGQGVQVFGGPGGGGQMQVMTTPGGGGGAWGGGGWNMGLDEQQRQLVREAITPQQAELQKLEEQLRAAQKEMMKAVFAENYDEKVMEEKADAVAKLQTKMYLIRSKAYNQAAPTLKQEQREYMENWGFFMLQNDWSLGIMPRGNVRGGGAGGVGTGVGAGVFAPQPERVRPPGTPPR